MRPILVCVDFSDITDRVIEKAAGWAAGLKTGLDLLHVIPPAPSLAVYAPGAAVALPMATATMPDLTLEKARLAELGDPLRARGLSVTERVAEGPVVREILRMAERIGPEAIVLGSHGHGALYELLVGSVTEGVLRRARRPVWVVPARS